MVYRRSSTPQVIFADDLTGANDTGVQFARVGLRTRVGFGEIQASTFAAADIVVIDTDSRHCVASDAYQRVSALARSFASRGTPVIYKKLDSTLRGALGAELDAVMDAYATQLVVLSPAFPANQRTLRDGVLYLNDSPIAQTPFAKDPQNPVAESHLPTLLAGQTQRTVHALGLDAITGGAPQLAARLQSLRTPRGAIAVCDAETDAHLAVLAEATLMLGAGCLLAGSAGLARPLAARIAPCNLPLACHNSDLAPLPSTARVLVVVGSIHPIIRQQLRDLVHRRAATVVALDLTAVDDAQWNVWRAQTLRRIESAPPAAPIVLTTPTLPVPSVQSAILLLRLAELTTALMARVPTLGVVATGGATVRTLCDYWQTAGIDLVDEIAPGIALGAVSGGRYNGLTLITKAGGFGDADTLAAIADYLYVRKQVWAQ